MPADIRNCRVLFIDIREHRIATRWGSWGARRHDPPPALAHPNSAARPDTGDILVVDDPNDRVMVIDGNTKQTI